MTEPRQQHMESRTHARGSLEYFPTPPWALRALVHEVLIGVLCLDLKSRRARDPAVGGGHLLPGLQETFAAVDFSDVADWGIDPPIRDFTFESVEQLAEDGLARPDWIITNPPFEIASVFALKAFEIAAEGVALFVRIGWLAGQGRYEKIFGLTPPTIVGVFSERVPLIEGAWDPQASSATDYVWIVWMPSELPRPIFHFRPGMQRKYTRMSDMALASPGEAARRAKAKKEAA